MTNKADLEDLESGEGRKTEDDDRPVEGEAQEPSSPQPRQRPKRVELQVDLRYFFSHEELRDIGMDMAKTEIHRNDLKATLDSIGSDYRSKIKADELVIKDCAMKIKNGFEYRRTECFKLVDYGAAIVSIFRKDDGELVEERPMTPAEKQVPMF